MFFLFRPYFFHSKICDRRERICPPSKLLARGARVFGNPETYPCSPHRKSPAFSTLKRVYREQCIHRVYYTPGNRLSDFSPLLDVPTVGGKMLPGKVLQQSGNAHATPAEPADDGVQFVPHILTDEHRLAVPDLRTGEVRFPVLLQRGPGLPGPPVLLSHGPSGSGGVSFLASRIPPPQRARMESSIPSRASVPADSRPGSIMSLSHHSSAGLETTAVLSGSAVSIPPFSSRFFSRFTFHCTWILAG